MPHEVRAFGGAAQPEGGGEELTHLVEGPRPRRAEEGLELRKREFNRIEVRTVRRQEADRGADLFDRRAHRGLFVERQVVEDHEVVAAERGHEDLLDVGEKTRIVERPIEDRWRRQPLQPERREDRVRLPVAERGVIDQSLAARAAAIPPQQIRRHATLVEKHEPLRIDRGHRGAPLVPGGDDVRPALLGGVDRFF